MVERVFKKASSFNGASTGLFKLNNKKIDEKNNKKLFQGTYYLDLAQTADINPMKPVMTKMHVESNRLQLADSINFRKYCFKIIDDETYEVFLK